MQHYENNVVVSFSGGKDSTVLLPLVRHLYPDTKAVFCDTGLEFPELKSYVKSVSNVDIIRPKMNFKEVIEKYGWVYPSKDVAQKIYYARKGSRWAINCLDGLYSDGSRESTFAQRYKKWKYLVKAPVKISANCCNIMKKSPLHSYARSHACAFFIGVLAEESSLRTNAWLKAGCNSYTSNQSMPLAFWTEQDVLQYIVENSLSIPSVYGDIVTDKNGSWYTTGEQRTGCMFCPIGATYEHYPNRFQRMAKSHPSIYKYCLNTLGLSKLLDFVGIPYKLEKDAKN